MLDKHIHRHVTDSLKDGIYECSDCGLAKSPFNTSTHEQMYDHFRIIHGIGGINPNQIDLKTKFNQKRSKISTKINEQEKINYLNNDLKENLFKTVLPNFLNMPTTPMLPTNTDLFFSAAALAAQKALLEITE